MKIYFDKATNAKSFRRIKTLIQIAPAICP